MIGPIIFAIQAVENLLLEIQKDTYKDFCHIVAECYTFVAIASHTIYGHSGKKTLTDFISLFALQYLF